MRHKLTLIVVTAVLLVGCVLIEKHCALTTWQLLLVYLVPYLLIGHDTLREAAEGLVHGEAFNEHFLMSVATIGALCIGFLPGAETQYPEAVFVMLFFQIGELLEGYAEDSSRKSIAHLMDIRPDVANVLDSNGELKKEKPEQVTVGTTIVVRPGEKIPLDGTVIKGSTELNTVALTGESAPREVHEGDEVVSGCVSLTGVIHIQTTKSYDDSTVAKIIELVEHASEHKSKSENFITRFARVYTPIVVLAAILVAFVPPLIESLITSHFSLLSPTWLYRALMFLVVSCPCALVISVPLTFFGGIGGASRQGILIKGAKFMDVLSRLKVVVFDKTGTLTRGEVLRKEDGTMSRVVVNDVVKDDARAAIMQLKQLGVEKTVMLTGDREEVAARVAREVGVDAYHSELLPADKVALFESLNTPHSSLDASPSFTAFVGDGINDAPVLARADVGIAMGGLGSDAAIEAADVVLMDDQPSKIATAIRIARRTLQIARQNVWFAIGVKLGVLILAAFGLATMWMAVFADVGVTVLAVLNAMRAMKSLEFRVKN
ncbi:MAG: HAD-IC family P-type ATPase [Prevotella sp.]|nr:HAD-IC family P-type ATPase [Prevotella sp.]